MKMPAKIKYYKAEVEGHPGVTAPQANKIVQVEGIKTDILIGSESGFIRIVVGARKDTYYEYGCLDEGGQIIDASKIHNNVWVFTDLKSGRIAGFSKSLKDRHAEVTKYVLAKIDLIEVAARIRNAESLKDIRKRLKVG